MRGYGTKFVYEEERTEIRFWVERFFNSLTLERKDVVTLDTNF